MEEVMKHNSDLDSWTVIDGKVYNLSPFVKMHPEGKAILAASGIDGSQIFRKH
jgi:cytochrome b involved in lipid metabolism